MAASVQQSAGGEFRPAEQDKRFIFAAAVAGDGYYVDRIMGEPHFKIRATTDDNTAASASNFALDLSAEGLTAATGAVSSASSNALRQVRDITIDVVATNGANRYRWQQRQRVGCDDSGNMILIGPKIFLTDCHAKLETAVGGSGTTTTETANCKAPAWFDGAAPAVGALSSGVATLNWLGASSPCGSLLPLDANFAHATASVANTRVCAHHNASITTGVTTAVIADLATPSASAADGTLTAGAIITPPCSVELFVNTTPTPDTLLVCLVGIASDVVAWQVGVTIGDPFLSLLA